LRYNYVMTKNKIVVKEWTLSYNMTGRKVPGIILSSMDVYKFSAKYLENTPIEKSVCIALDAQCNIIGYMIQQGTIDTAPVYAREIFLFLLSAGASRFCMAHNHPTGNCTPSRDDWKMVKSLRYTGVSMCIEMIDSIIIGDTVLSMTNDKRWNS
jgi:DNA repair protein RadC